VYDPDFHRLTQQNVTQPGDGVDTTVLSIRYAYDSLGRRYDGIGVIP